MEQGYRNPGGDIKPDGNIQVTLSSFDDELSKIFRACLLRWITPAGATPPQ